MQYTFKLEYLTSLQLKASIDSIKSFTYMVIKQSKS